MHPVMSWLKSKKAKKSKGAPYKDSSPNGEFGFSAKMGKSAGPSAKGPDKKGSGSPKKKIVDNDADDK